MCVCVYGGGEGGSAWTITLNLSGAVANILSPSVLVSLTRSLLHLSLALIPLCNCALIFQCQSGLCPQPPTIFSHSRHFLISFARFSHLFCPIFFFPFLLARGTSSSPRICFVVVARRRRLCRCRVPFSANVCVCAPLCLRACWCPFSARLFRQHHLSLLFVCEREIDKYN